MNTQSTNDDDAAKKAITKSGLILVVVLGLGGLFWVLFKPDYANQPSYGGKNLGLWLIEVDHGQPETTRKAAREAIEDMGTNALPFILNRFQASGSRFGLYFNAVLAKIPRIKFRFTTADDRIRRATWGLHALGPSAKMAIPELQRLLLTRPGYVPDSLRAVGDKP